MAALCDKNLEQTDIIGLENDKTDEGDIEANEDFGVEKKKCCYTYIKLRST